METGWKPVLRFRLSRLRGVGSERQRWGGRVAGRQKVESRELRVESWAPVSGGRAAFSAIAWRVWSFSARRIN